MSIKTLPAFKRPREKIFEKGAHTLTDTELLMLVLRSGSKEKDVIHLAKNILPSGNIRDILAYSNIDLRDIRGIGLAGSSTILAVREIAMRLYKTHNEPYIESAEDVVKIVSNIRDKKKEYFVGLYVNARQQLIKNRIISIGSLDASLVHPREVFGPAIELNASGLIISHNHPSGNPEPSHADIVLTQRLYRAGDLLGIQLIDHIIVASQSYFSMAEHGQVMT